MGNSGCVILQGRQGVPIKPDPWIRSICLTMEKPSLANNQADVDKLRIKLSEELGLTTIPLKRMNDVARECRAGDWKVTVTVCRTEAGWELIDIQGGHRHVPLYGLAVDIGTTTVVTALINLTNGEMIDTEADYNGQVTFGEDILTRIYRASEESGLAEMQSAVIQTLNVLTQKLCRRNGLQVDKIAGTVAAGNTTMIHLLLGLYPGNICMAPYIPVVNRPGFLNAREVGLMINPDAPLYCLPGISSYVGGDALAGVLVSGMHERDEIALFVDIGTNGEMVLGNKDWLVACAGAAGPALEGGVAACGVRADVGAIDKVYISRGGQVSYHVIGETKARGICGSGLVDCLAQMFLAGIVDRKAKFKSGDRFIIVPGRESATGEDIVVTQKDIDSLMRTKGAVSAALEYMLESVGCSLADLGAFYAAGAFGEYLDLDSAVTIGLYPDLNRQRMVRLGNSSLEGARQVLVSDEKRRELESIKDKITYFELNADENFMNKFVSSKFLPHTNLDLFPTVKAKLEERGLIKVE